MTQLTVGAGGVSPQAPFSIKSTKFYFKHVLLFRFLVSIPIWQGFQYLLCVLVDNELAIAFLRFGLFLSLVSCLVPIYWLLSIWNGRLRNIFFLFPIFSSFSNYFLQLYPYMYYRYVWASVETIWTFTSFFSSPPPPPNSCSSSTMCGRLTPTWVESLSHKILTQKYKKYLLDNLLLIEKIVLAAAARWPRHRHRRQWQVLCWSKAEERQKWGFRRNFSFLLNKYFT